MGDRFGCEPMPLTSADTFQRLGVPSVSLDISDHPNPISQPCPKQYVSLCVVSSCLKLVGIDCFIFGGRVGSLRINIDAI